MPNDAKLGMTLGVCLVIVVSVLFSRKDASGEEPGGPRAITPAPRISGVRGPVAPMIPSPGGIGQRSSRSLTPR
jgi:hypothetical protein